MTILVIAAHPDDEVLGCGGVMARHVAAGETVVVAIMAQGVTSRGQTMGQAHNMEGKIQALRDVARTANKCLGVTDVRFFDFPDNRMDGVDGLEVTKAIEALIEDVDPHTVYTHHPGDLNVDHGVVCASVMTACRPIPGAPVRSIYYFEVASSTEWQVPHSSAPFTPTLFMDITTCLDKKEKALLAYAPEMRPFPHARSVEAVVHLAKWRGASVGVEAAEAFAVARQVR